nr:universal stress protein [uncultured Methanospirillum sp.]
MADDQNQEKNTGNQSRDTSNPALIDVQTLFEENVKVVLRCTIDALLHAGLSYDLKVAIGEPSVEIVAIAKKEMADLIVIGSRGLGAIKGVLLGSVSQKIAQTAPCPVMIVR